MIAAAAIGLIRVIGHLRATLATLDALDGGVGVIGDRTATVGSVVESVNAVLSGFIRTDPAWEDRIEEAEERFLFRCLWDGRNVELCKEMGKELNEFIADKLTGYPLFAGLDGNTLKMIRVTRMMFAQKLAYWLNVNSNYLREKGIEDIDDYIRRASMAIFDGFRLQFAAQITFEP